MSFLANIFWRNKKVIQKPKQFVVEQIFTDEEKKADKKHKVKQLFENIEKGNTVRANIDGRSILFRKKKNEERDT